VNRDSGEIPFCLDCRAFEITPGAWVRTTMAPCSRSVEAGKIAGALHSAVGEYLYPSKPAPRSVSEEGGDEARLREIETRVQQANHGPWRVFRRELEWSEEGRREFGAAAPAFHENLIGTARDHPQFKAPLPIVGSTTRPYHKDGDKHGVAIEDGDAEFIAHARQDIPWLLDRVRSLESRLRAAGEDGERLQRAESVIREAAYLMAARAEGKPWGESTGAAYALLFGYVYPDAAARSPSSEPRND
jgi:hypothetical protein